MKKRRITILLIAVGHFALSLLVLSGSHMKYGIMPVPADTTVYSSQVCNFLLPVLTIPLLCLLWVGNVLNHFVHISPYHEIFLQAAPFCLPAFVLNSWINALFLVWLWPKLRTLKKLKQRKTEQTDGAVTQESARSTGS